MMTRRGTWCALAAAAALVLWTPGPSARADVSPGDRITDQNVDKIKDLISPGLEWCIKHGFPLTIGETKRIEWPTAYKEATEKYSGQVKLRPDGLQLLNYVAGQPFPKVDPQDPQVAVKIMWNYEYKFNPTDDLDLRNFDADTGAVADHGHMTVERHFLLDHLKVLCWNAGLVVDPKPERPNPNGYRGQSGLYPILEPFDLKGVGGMFYRYLDPARQDDTWLYLPQLRRVRRLSSAQRSDALFGQDTDQDSYGGYAGNIAWMDWKYLGEKTVLSSMHGKKMPVQWGEPSGDFMHADLWEPRKVWIIEGISKLPQYAYSKRVMYLDQESYFIAYSDIYDTAGELWKMWVNEFKISKKPRDEASYESQ